MAGRPLSAHHKPPTIIAPLGLVGGFLDAAGGGGWGPVVTGNLLVQGAEPRKTIGTVNTSEFLVTLTSAATFIAALGWAAFTLATVGLLIGGVVAAPLGAWLVEKNRSEAVAGDGRDTCDDRPARTIYGRSPDHARVTRRVQAAGQLSRISTKRVSQALVWWPSTTRWSMVSVT